MIFSKNTLFFFKNDFSFYYLKLYTPSVPLIGGFKAFFDPPFCSLTEGKEEKDGSRGKSGSVCLAAALTWMIIGIVKEAVHKKGQIDQKCAINCYIKGNVSSKNFTKYKNMFVVKSILKSIQRFARYRIVALIWIGRLCTSAYNYFFQHMRARDPICWNWNWFCNATCNNANFLMVTQKVTAHKLNKISQVKCYKVNWKISRMTFTIF